MRKACLTVALLLAATSAHAGGFFLGGAADGAAVAQDIELQRRALEIDRRLGTSTYQDVRRDQQMRDLQRAIDENNALLRAERARRGILLDGIR